MALQKQPVSINFTKGLDLKSDPYQVTIGNFLALSNSVFNTTGRLTKRNGYKNLTNLPDTNETILTTLNDNLIATGSSLYAYSQDTNTWLNKGVVQPVRLDTQPLVRVSTSQKQPDVAIASNGLACTVYVDGSTAYYQISDSKTGEQIISRTAIDLTNVARIPRVFLLGTYFIITYTINGPFLKYLAIPTATPSSPKAPATISSTINATNSGYDGYSANGFLFLAWGGTGTTVRVAYLTQALAVSPESTIASSSADRMSVTVDEVNQVVWVSYWSAASGNNGFSAAFNYILGQLMAATPIITSTVITEITSTPSTSGILSVFYQVTNNYSYTDSISDAIRTDYIDSVTVTRAIGTGVGTVTSPVIVLRSVGLASKSFISAEGVIYMLAVYGDIAQTNPDDNSNQSTYFLIDSAGVIYSRLAYANAGGYNTIGILPSVTVQNDTFIIPYLVADFLTTVNKGTALPSGQPTNAIYTQYGINLASFTVNSVGQYSSEIAGALHLTGGQLWEYDGVKPVEHGFHVWPENIAVTQTSTVSTLGIGDYYYVFTYEWTDAAGNLHRSAPSIPIFIHVSSANTTANVLHVPTLRLTDKLPPNPVRIVGYRYSVAQPVYYQFTSITSPTLNDVTVDQVTITDAKSDALILGQTLLYTTGGVVENIAAPASIASCLFDNRLFLVTAEDQNLMWFSKQVIETTPVEMSDLLTIYVAPTTGAQKSTGPITALAAMDDKLIVFKKDAIYYINGNGPDITGANSTYSQPIFVTGTVGCANPNSIVLTPSGLMFQSDKGIWLLGRGLDYKYVGDRVESYNSVLVKSAACIPGTNQVRFVLNGNYTTLMYDYYFNEWSTHTNIAAASATLYQGAHTYLNSFGQVFQEIENYYLDGSKPVLMSLTTSWINIAGLQGYERFYFANLLGTYYTPFILNVSIAYDYASGPQQSTQILPDNYSAKWGGEALWGSGGPWGGPGNVFSARLFPEKQKCESFQVTIQEVYDPSLGQAAGQGLSLSGLALVVGMKRGFRTQSARKSFG